MEDNILDYVKKTMGDRTLGNENDLIRRGDAADAIRQACVLGHIPFDSKSPEGQRTLEALWAVNTVPAALRHAQDAEAWAKLKEYEATEAAGLLVRLPCKVGDMVYTIGVAYFDCENCPYGAEAKYNPVVRKALCDRPGGRHCPYIIEENRCEGFEIRENSASDPGEWGYERLETFFSVGDFGLYYSREAAEAALAERKEQNNE